MARPLTTRWLVACLCAEWCGSCRDYRQAFESVAQELADIAQFAWTDIEDQPEVMDDLEIESFPTILIAREAELAFFGPVEPFPAALASLVRRAVAGSLGSVDDAALAELAARVRRAVA